MGKRKDYISWDDYFISIAVLASKRSKDPSTQVGACIVDKDSNRILGQGYNGFPIGCDDDDFPWERDGEYIDTKYPYVVHAEANAILSCKVDSLDNAKLYVTLFPCENCCKLIIQSGIKEILYLSNKYKDTDSVKASIRMFESAGIKMTKLKPRLKRIELLLDLEE
ncbi:deoxycytidylate deaminase [Clostridium perfringens]